MDGYPFMTTRAPAVLKTDSAWSHLLPAGRVQPGQAEEAPHLFVQYGRLQLHHFLYHLHDTFVSIQEGERDL